MKQLNQIFALTAFLLITSLSYAIDYESMFAGNWNDPLIWSTDGGVTSCGCFPGNPTFGDNITINHSVTMTQNIGINGGSTLLVSTTGALTGPTYNVTVWQAGSTIDIYGPTAFQRLQNGVVAGNQGGIINVYSVLQLNAQTRFYAGTTTVDGGYMYLTVGNFNNYPNSTFNTANSAKLELFGGNVSNGGVLFICPDCCITTLGNWTNEATGTVSGSGSATTTGGNMNNNNIFSPAITWCSAGADTGMPSPEDCGTSTTTCGLVMLPVELAEFNGFTDGTINTITWITVSERDNDYFLLQRSPDGTNWVDVAQIEGQGTSMTETRYSYEDYATGDAITYYRLEQVNYDGSSQFSAPISITSNLSEQLSYYPNPTSGQFLYVDGVSDINDISIINQYGQPISGATSESMSKNQIKIDISGLSSGIYFLKSSSSQKLYKVMVK